MAPTNPKKKSSRPRSEPARAARTTNVVRVSRSGGSRGGERLSARTLEERAQRMLEVLGLEGVELSVALVDDAAIRALNKAYRKKDKPTDVLSFAQHDDALAAYEARRVSGVAAEHGLLLGDVIVSVDTAARQAAERGRTLGAELVTLLAHGLLHLAGFDHRTDDEEREMNAYASVLEAAALGRAPLRLGLRARG